MILLLEGIDGTGKTTLCNHSLELICNFNRQAKIVPGLSKEYKEELSEETDDIKKGLIVLKSFKYAIDEIRYNEENNIITILDRFLPSTFAYQVYQTDGFTPNIGINGNSNRDEFLIEYKYLHKVLYSDFNINIIYLTASKYTIENRLDIRERDNLDNYSVSNNDRILRGYNYYFNELTKYINKEGISNITTMELNTDSDMHILLPKYNTYLANILGS